MQRFKAEIQPVPGGGNYVVVPAAVADAVGLQYGARVRGTLDGVPYRSSLMKYSGVYHMGTHKAVLAAAEREAGDVVDIAIELDTEPLPNDTLPPELAAALKKNKQAKAGFEALSPAHRREHVGYIMDAKKAETRERRVLKTIEALVEVAAERAAKDAAKAAKKAAKKTKKA